MTQLRSHPRLVRKLQDALGDQLCVALDDATVVEIMLNPDGRLFIERLGHGVAPAGAMSAATAEVVIGSVAHALQSEADDERPIISGELPIGGHRFEGLLPPVVSAPAFTIRRRASRLIPLDDYVKATVMTEAQASVLRSAIASRMGPRYIRQRHVAMAVEHNWTTAPISADRRTLRSGVSLSRTRFHDRLREGSDVPARSAPEDDP